MKKSKIAYFVVIISVFISCISKKEEPLGTKQDNLTFIKNDSIKHMIVLASEKKEGLIVNKGNRVIVIIGKEKKEILEKIEPNKWLNLLSNNDSDWAANLFLYSLFEVDALLLSVYDSKEEWKRERKKEDTELWIDFFHKDSIPKPNLHFILPSEYNNNKGSK